jgi:hypothetical protein
MSELAAAWDAELAELGDQPDEPAEEVRAPPLPYLALEKNRANFCFLRFISSHFPFLTFLPP